VNKYNLQRWNCIISFFTFFICR